MGKKQCKEDSQMGGRNECIFVIAVEPVAFPSFISLSWLLVSLEWADRMRLLQPLPSEIGPAGPGVGKELHLAEAETSLNDGKVCHVLPDNVYVV